MLPGHGHSKFSYIPIPPGAWLFRTMILGVLLVISLISWNLVERVNVNSEFLRDRYSSLLCSPLPMDPSILDRRRMLGRGKSQNFFFSLAGTIFPPLFQNLNKRHLQLQLELISLHLSTEIGNNWFPSSLMWIISLENNCYTMDLAVGLKQRQENWGDRFGSNYFLS
jgi:hypothetical protein